MSRDRKKPALRILIVSAQFPYPPRSGFTMRVYQLARRLADRHEVTLLSYAWPHEYEGVAALARELKVHAVERQKLSAAAKRTAQALSVASLRPYYCREVESEAMQREISRLCSTQRFDVVQLESSFLCTFAFPTPACVVIDEHNVEYEVFERMCEGERSFLRRGFNRIESARFRRFERAWWRRSDGCVVTSERELAVLRSYAPETAAEVAPNGVDLDYFYPSPDDPAPRSLVFNGILTYRPNVDAAYHLVEEVWPLVLQRVPEAELTLVGRADGIDLGRLRRPGVTVAGEVPDIRPYLRRASVVAVPIRIGGGTRLKVVESLAMGKPIVSTAIGCEGIAVRDGKHLLIADDPEAFAARVVELFERPDLARNLGSAGRRLVTTDYSWDISAARVEALHQRVMANRKIVGPLVRPYPAASTAS